MSDRTRNLKAIVFVVLGFALFSINDILIKAVAQSYSVAQTLFWTSFFVCPILIVYGLVFESAKSFKTKVMGWHSIRGLFMTLMVLCNIYALMNLQITDFYAIVFMGPLFLSLMSWLFLKDSLDLKRLVAILLGFVAVLYMCRPGGDLFNLGALSAAMGVVFFSTATLFVRSKLREENPLLVGINGPIIMMIVAIPLMFVFGFSFPTTGIDWLLFFAAGASAGFGGVFFAKGFQFATSAAVVAPFHYTQMIWGAILGYLIFDEIPSKDVVIGSIVLAGLGIYLIYTEAQTYKRTLSEKENLVQHGPF